ncbi:MAG: 50S ribosomal protein L31 [Deltaproteobacteria bacterium]|nr:50S ribosomal protein L31 [Deltaproteobacteria bacterium]
MKEGIHPKYQEVKVVCGGCGAEHVFGSTRPGFEINVCSECHPFYTGKQKFLDTEGRIDKFKAKYANVKLQSKPKKSAA